jgi:hypothetical protein
MFLALIVIHVIHIQCQTELQPIAVFVQMDMHQALINHNVIFVQSDSILLGVQKTPWNV